MNRLDRLDVDARVLKSVTNSLVHTLHLKATCTQNRFSWIAYSCPP